MAKEDGFGGMGVVLMVLAAWAIVSKKAGAATVTQPSGASYTLANTLPNARGNIGSDSYTSWLQQSLNTVLGAGIPVNGIMDANTRAWVIRFQQTWGITADGVVGPETDYSLRSALGQAGYIEQPYDPGTALATAGEY